MLLHFDASACILKYKCNTAKLDLHKHTYNQPAHSFHQENIKKQPCKATKLFDAFKVHSHGASATVLKNHLTLEVYVAVETVGSEQLSSRTSFQLEDDS